MEVWIKSDWVSCPYLCNVLDREFVVSLLFEKEIDIVAGHKRLLEL